MAVGPDSGRVERDEKKRGVRSWTSESSLPNCSFRCGPSDPPHGPISILLLCPSFTPHGGIPPRWTKIFPKIYRHQLVGEVQAPTSAASVVSRFYAHPHIPTARSCVKRCSAFHMLWQKLPDELRMHICPGGQPPLQPALSATAAPYVDVQPKHTHKQGEISHNVAIGLGEQLVYMAARTRRRDAASALASGASAGAVATGTTAGTAASC